MGRRAQKKSRSRKANPPTPEKPVCWPGRKKCICGKHGPDEEKIAEALARKSFFQSNLKPAHGKIFLPGEKTQSDPVADAFNFVTRQLQSQMVEVDLEDFNLPGTLARKVAHAYLVDDGSLPRFRAFCKALKKQGLNPNVRRAYHGTSASNVGDILHYSLRQGEGGLFGGGVYMSPTPVKALNYARGAVLVVRVAMGKVARPLIHLGTQQAVRCLQRLGCHSFAASGRIKKAWGGRLLHTEWVVYNADQVVVDGVLWLKK